MVIPRSLEEAREFLSRFPPPPPGRNINMNRVRQCHGCHGYNDEDHDSVPMGAGRCPLQHDDRCLGGIVGGKDGKGKDWQPCPSGYHPPTERPDFHDDDDSEGQVSDDDEDNLDVAENLNDFEQLSGQVNPPTSSASHMSSAGSPPTTTGAGSTAGSVLSSATLSFQTTTVGSGLGLVSSPQSFHKSDLASEMAALQILRQEREVLEQQAKLVEHQQQSAKRLELGRQLKAEKDRIRDLKKLNKQAESVSSPSADPNLVDNLRQQSQCGSLSATFQSQYKGPNIKAIRKTPGLRKRVEERVETVRSDIPSLSRRPTAGSAQTKVSARRREKPVDSVEEEFQRFKAWQQSQGATAALSDSESEASPPRAAPHLKNRKKKSVIVEDPITDSSSSEDEDSQTKILVYRRDASGIKYRSYEPANHLGKLGHNSHSEATKQHNWVKDPSTGREYKQPGKSSNICSKATSSSGTYLKKSSYTDHMSSSSTPQTGHRSGVRSPRDGRPNLQERVPGIIPLEEREGKSDDKRLPTILDWVKNCPVTYAEKLKYEEMNLPLWVWGYVFEILSSRTGLSPDMPRGELEARLQHLLCVLQVTLIHSEKSEFCSTGWSIASIYAKRIQQKLDRKLDTWDSFGRFGHDPHPSEMFAAKTEADTKAPAKKKGEADRKSGRERRMCPTWNNCETQRKCQYLVDNPTATKCLFRHECSYCIENNHGQQNHQRRFCSKKRAAGNT